MAQLNKVMEIPKQCPVCGTKQEYLFVNHDSQSVDCQKCGYHKDPRVEVKAPYGSFRIEYSDTENEQWGCIIDESDATDFIHDIPKLKEKTPQISKITIHRWSEEDGFKEFIVYPI